MPRRRAGAPLTASTPHCTEQKKGANVVNLKVEGKCNDKDFSYDAASASYKVDGTKYANRKAIKQALGALTFADTKMTFDEAARPSGFDGGRQLLGH